MKPHNGSPTSLQRTIGSVMASANVHLAPAADIAALVATATAARLDPKNSTVPVEVGDVRPRNRDVQE